MQQLSTKAGGSTDGPHPSKVVWPFQSRTVNQNTGRKGVIFPVRNIPGRLSSCPHIPRAPGTGGGLGGELAKVGRAAGWAESSPDCQGNAQRVPLDPSPGPSCLWEGLCCPRTRDQWASASERLYQPLWMPSRCFYLSLPQDVVCTLLLSVNGFPPPNSLSQNILSAPTYNHKPKQRGSRWREICTAALWMPASWQIICLQIVSDTGSHGCHHLSHAQVCFSNSVKNKKNISDVLSLPFSGFNLSQALLQASLLLARELDWSASCIREWDRNLDLHNIIWTFVCSGMN